ncbi:cytochrome C [Fulvimarina endophytica]|uniref:Cytochrome C n=2 Tax=Fulvimarina endophytica TaxID=2293836 RepID=A0A371X0G6_9HYPH|nr:cytochrome C [Fulvimarina endophytica]
MGNVSNPEPDAHPSKDTQEEGNKVSSFNANDASEDPGLALDTAEKPVYAFAGETPDWYTWRGYKKYGANCLQCHGPDGMGSSFAPDLTQSLQNIDYFEFAGIIVGGQQNKWNTSGNSIMPAWGEDPNVMCSLNAIYTYLRGRADGVVGRGEPGRPEQSDKSKAAKDYEYSCLGF